MMWRSVARTILQVIPDRTVVPVLSGPLRGARWVKGSGNASYWLGTYEAKKQKMFFRSLHEADIVFDIGAHAGFYTLLASRAVGIRGKIVAFEPSPKNIEILRRHVHLNQCGNVTIIGAAVTNTTGYAQFNEGENSFVGRIVNGGAAAVTIPTMSIDEGIIQGTLPIPMVMKIDAEGEEEKILRGARTTLMRYHPSLFLALHNDENRLHCLTILRECGYHVESIGDRGLDVTDEVFATLRPDSGSRHI